ncbi:hypothetical protein L3C95_34600 [Chitinophaga filiformis]|uniref:hypothetical protein n=1 Tax=Chitinophaga filiformis TaxID=104663 RepID=UPI001F2B07E3|nr:hypothetical protein [Chitinophaga filiformis]MCF6408070.1 hypothetical protein [Chitinophaga filiformis]
MEFRTARSHYNTFYMIVLGIVLGVIIPGSLGALKTRMNWYFLPILSAALLLPYACFRVYLSIDIADEQLVLTEMNFFGKKVTIFNIKEVELRLYYIPRPPVRKGRAFYSMYIIKGGKILHQIEHDMKELSVFIDRFNRKKATI